MEPSNDFTCFPKLPAELRFMVWKIILAEPRVVHIVRGVRGRARALGGHPSLLHVCQESRQEALKHYQLSFGVLSVAAPPGTPCGRGTIYCNFDIDTMLFDVVTFKLFTNRSYCRVLLGDLDKIRKLALFRCGDKQWSGIMSSSSFDKCKPEELFCCVDLGFVQRTHSPEKYRELQEAIDVSETVEEHQDRDLDSPLLRVLYAELESGSLNYLVRQAFQMQRMLKEIEERRKDFNTPNIRVAYLERK